MVDALGFNRLIEQLPPDLRVDFQVRWAEVKGDEEARSDLYAEAEQAKARLDRPSEASFAARVAPSPFVGSCVALADGPGRLDTDQRGPDVRGMGRILEEALSKA